MSVAVRVTAVWMEWPTNWLVFDCLIARSGDPMVPKTAAVAVTRLDWVAYVANQVVPWALDKVKAVVERALKPLNARAG